MSCSIPETAMLAFMSFGFSEILLVGIVALLVFGGNLPDVMRSLGRSYGKLRASLHEFSRPVREELREVSKMPPRTETPPESQPQVPEYPDYGGPPPPPVTSSKEPVHSEEEIAESKAPETPATGSAADEPPPV